MIDDTIIDAFGDELSKIAGLIGDTGRALKTFARTGWNKPAGIYEKAKHMEGALKGKNMLDAAGKQVWHERPDATWFGKGKVTRYLPIGDKSIISGITAASIPGAVRKEDDTGQNRSRAERVSGLAGGTLGSVLGMGALAHIPGFRGTGPMKSLGITRAIIGGLGGGILGEHLATKPFHAGKAQLPPVQSAPEQSQIPKEIIV